MRVIRAPAEHRAEAATSPRTLFLAGGVSGASDWRARAADLLADLDVVLLDPRRFDVPWDDPAAVAGQVGWEAWHLAAAWGRAFWFGPESLCPLALFELGRACQMPGPLFVGADPGYGRRIELVAHVGAVRPEVRVVGTVADLAGVVRHGLDAPGKPGR